VNIAMFYHSLVSDWNHGNAHFLRGIVSELISRGHEVTVYEPVNAWSRWNLVERHGPGPIEQFHQAYPELTSIPYQQDDLDLEEVADEADLVIVHEWSDDWLINGWNKLRAQRSDFRLLFHDTHHRAVSDPRALGRVNLSAYDGILAFGEVLREVYRTNGWGQSAWIWHEAADTRMFHPLPASEKDTELVWIGNWGDDERTQELEEFLFSPARQLGIRLRLHGVRYPEGVLERLAAQGVEYGGWLPNFKVPQAFARAKVTVHVPRRPYTRLLQGIPTIRPFEALACGIPLVCAPWNDREHLFTPGKDYLVAHDGEEMKRHLRQLLNEPDFAQELATHGRNTILSRHTCAHRIDELLAICRTLGLTESEPRSKLATVG